MITVIEFIVLALLLAASLYLRSGRPFRASDAVWEAYENLAEENGRV